ncbi:hypothetical protein HAX54_039607 [Datura stramonium]|uniref:Uncharacterized protein n=1 Tax=Datura stramonium TaxID=4076 RepID=A0ABS8VMW8_DATST|nr:hypothetical protein [Datura stramonium]
MLGLNEFQFPSTPHLPRHDATSLSANPTVGAVENTNFGEDITQEDAVCRICFVELGEGSSRNLKMEVAVKDVPVLVIVSMLGSLLLSEQLDERHDFKEGPRPNQSSEVSPTPQVESQTRGAEAGTSGVAHGS